MEALQGLNTATLRRLYDVFNFFVFFRALLRFYEGSTESLSEKNFFSLCQRLKKYFHLFSESP